MAEREPRAAVVESTSLIDFARSFVTFFTTPAQGNSIARIQLDATCTLFGGPSGAAETYYLSAACRSEHMYLDDGLFQMPNYEFCGVFSRDRCLLLRTHWTSDRDWHEPGENTVRFARVAIDLRPYPSPRLLTSPEAIVAATLANEPLVATTELRDAASGRRAILTYPVKAPPQFQVDTGPLLVPRPGASAPNPIECFETAHVVYNRLSQAEFIYRRPVSIGEREGAAVSVTDYSVVETLPATHQIWSGEPAS
jgi:hypothetical protein